LIIAEDLSYDDAGLQLHDIACSTVNLVVTMAGIKRQHKSLDDRPAKKSKVSTSAVPASHKKEETADSDNQTGGVASPKDTFLNGM
jgi:hypothetical protein